MSPGRPDNRPPMSALDPDEAETLPPGDRGANAKSHDAHPPLPPQLAGAPAVPGYHLLEKLGEGGMGVVWKAVQLTTRRPVALKLLGAASFGSEEARLRFEREVELAARLEHPFIARVYDSGQSHGVHFYAMELVEGLDLETHVRTHTLNTREILGLARDVCLGVQHAHQRGVIHRDLKPSNILVSQANHEDTTVTKIQDRDESKTGLRSATSSIENHAVPKIVDFGLAKTLSAEEGQPLISHAGQIAGTPAYMSPEQAAGKSDRIDTRSDVYALGVILYRLLTGAYPHDTAVPFATLLRHISENDIVRPRQASDDASKVIDRELETLLLKTLAKSPDRRYDNAGALASDLDNYLQGRPLLAKAPTTFYVLSKQLKRHRKFVTAVGVFGLLLLGGAGGGATWLYNRPVDLRVDSEPGGGHLVINGQLKLGCGTTPCHATLGPGNHTIEVVVPGHYQPEVRTITVRWGQASTTAWEPIVLKPDFRTVFFTTEPTRAHVQIRREDNGQIVETSATPALIKLSGGRYTMHFSRDGELFPETGRTLAIVGDTEPLTIKQRLEP